MCGELRINFTKRKHLFCLSSMLEVLGLHWEVPMATGESMERTKHLPSCQEARELSLNVISERTPHRPKDFSKGS